MEFKFQAYSIDELELAADFLKRLAALQRKQIAVKAEVPQGYMDRINAVGEARPGAVLGGMTHAHRYVDGG